MLRKWSLPILAALWVPLMTACGSDAGTEPTVPTVASVTVSPDARELDAVGATAGFSAQAQDAGGSPIQGVAFTWTSSNTDVATVDASGEVTARGNGSATITAAADGRSGTASVTVQQDVSMTHSSFSVDPATVRADGTSSVEVSVLLEDANGHPVADRSVTIEVTGPDATIVQPSPTDDSGQTTGTLTSDTEGTRTISVWVGDAGTGDPLPQTEDVEFLALDACLDEDGDGVCDAASCDAGLPIDPSDPLSAAAAMGICAAMVDEGYGLVSAEYTRANGSSIAVNQQIGVLTTFGPNVVPQEGASLLVLSSGRARTPTDPGACGSSGCAGVGAGFAPPGFPQASEGCTLGSSIYDDVALTVTLRAPANARGLAFRSKYYTFDYPVFLCGDFNDQFVVLADPAPVGGVGGNVTFDAQGDPLSVNTDFLDVCSGCALGTDELTGTGFDTWGGSPAGATGWLRTTVPVDGRQEITLRFIIWDTGDQILDSTVLLDGFEWLLMPPETSTERVSAP